MLTEVRTSYWFWELEGEVAKGQGDHVGCVSTHADCHPSSIRVTNSVEMLGSTPHAPRMSSRDIDAMTQRAKMPNRREKKCLNRT